MNRLARSAIIWRALLTLVVCMPVAGAARAEGGDDDVQIAVTVMPTAPAGAVSAVLTGGSPLVWSSGLHRLVMGLLVVDNRPEPGGWEITVSQRARPRASAELWLLGIGAHPPELARWPPASTPRHISAGQPLSRPTIILATAPGEAPPRSWTPLAMGSPSWARSEPQQMLVTVAFAP